MAWFPIANTVPQYWKQAADGTNEYSGAVLKAYQVGTLTNIAFATDNTGGTTANSIALNANGHPEVSGNVVIPHLDQDYKLALYPDQTSADADSGATWTIDDIDLMGFDSGSLSPEHATDSGTDTYDSAVNTSAPDTGTEIVRDFQSTNSTTTPTLDSITLKDRDGNPLWPGAINGAHRLFYDGTDYLVLDLRASSGVVDPEHATDSGTDAYVSATNTTPPADGVKITRDFQSANTTTTPSLDGKTLTTRDGSALWAAAVSGVHALQYDSGADTYLVLEPRWQLAPFFAGHIDGLELLNGTDADHDIDIATGVCSMRDGSGNRKLFNLTTGLTKAIDGNWTDGGLGGFPSGLTLSADTTYHVFVIGKDNGDVEAGFDTSTSATNLLSDASNYSWFRRIGSLYTDGSSNWVSFSQNDNEFLIDPVNDYSVADPGISATTQVLSVPTGIAVWALHSFVIRDAGPTRDIEVLVTSFGQTDTQPTSNIQDIRTPDINDASGTSHGNVFKQIRTGTSGTIRVRVAISDADVNIKGTTHGWIDTRGRNA